MLNTVLPAKSKKKQIILSEDHFDVVTSGVKLFEAFISENRMGIGTAQGEITCGRIEELCKFLDSADGVSVKGV